MAISSCQATSISVSWGVPWDLAPGKLVDMDTPPHSFPGVANTLNQKRKLSLIKTQSMMYFMCRWCLCMIGLPRRFSSVGEHNWLLNTFRTGSRSNKSTWWGHRACIFSSTSPLNFDIRKKTHSLRLSIRKPLSQTHIYNTYGALHICGPVSAT